MKPTAAVIQGSTGSWFVVVRHPAGTEQRYECANEERAQSFFRVFDETAKPKARPARPKPSPEEPSGLALKVFARLVGLLNARWPSATAEAPAAAGPRQFEVPRLEVCRSSQERLAIGGRRL